MLVNRLDQPAYIVLGLIITGYYVLVCKDLPCWLDRPKKSKIFPIRMKLVL